MNMIEFVRESNMIEGIHRDPTPEEVEVHEAFIYQDTVNIADLSNLVSVCQPDAVLRD